MAPRKRNNPTEPSSQSLALDRPENPTLTFPSLGATSTGLCSYYPETQSQAMKSSMRPRGGVFGIVDLEMAMPVAHESVLWERTCVDPRHVDVGYVDPGYEVFGIVNLESVVVIGVPIGGDEEELFPGAEAGPEECVA